MDLIRSRIASGEYPTDSQIPSTRKWEDDGWSRDVVRIALAQIGRQIAGAETITALTLACR